MNLNELKAILGIASVALAIEEMEAEPDTRPDMTEEHKAKLDAWLVTIATGTLEDMGKAILEMETFHQGPEGHAYKGLCTKLHDMARITSMIGDLRFGNEAYHSMLMSLPDIDPSQNHL